jgi:5'-nucleotidase
VAVSQVSSSEQHLATAAAVAAATVTALDAAWRPAVLNVNVPSRPMNRIEGIRTATLATRGSVQAAFVAGSDGHLNLEFHEPGVPPEPGSDAALLAEGFITITELASVAAVEGGDAVDPSTVEDELVRLVPALVGKQSDRSGR